MTAAATLAAWLADHALLTLSVALLIASFACAVIASRLDEPRKEDAK